MCGIFATTRPDLWRDLQPELLAKLDHRGPDAHGAWESPGGDVLLLHTRLSIVGLGSEGAQPAVLPSGEAITFNGEVYNYRDLAVGLTHGAAVSDTQTVIQRIARDGLSAMDAFRGMYALAYWDPASRTLSAARDPWGIKPLYLLDHPSGGVTLSSEIGPLLLHADGRELDPIGIAQYVAFGHTLPQFTCYLRIRKVVPGAVYSWQMTESRHVNLSIQRIHQFEPDEIPTVGAAMEDSVRAHLTADVEVGVFLSGGIDSTLVTAIAREIVPDLHAFTLSFPGSEGMDESPLAAANARALGVRHTIVPVTASDMLDSLDTMLATTGEPFGDAAALPLLFLARRAAQDLKVVLTGEGADELFGGYGRYRISRALPRHHLPILGDVSAHLADVIYQHRSDRPRSRAVEAILRLGGARSHAALLGSDLPALMRTTSQGREVETLMRTDWEGFTDGAGGREAARRFDLGRWLPNTYLEKTDRATMAMSLEARTPFLDPVVARAALAAGRPFGKGDLRVQLESKLPDVELPNKKQGLAVPIKTLLDSSLGSDLERVLGSKDSVLQRTLGSDCVLALAERSTRSLSTAYRLAVFGRWEAASHVVV
jgi:asparagine synthase (glutamine-hydrolysing)